MNIIKLKDTIYPGDSDEAQFFNKMLKGKYAFWIQMRYVVPLENISVSDYAKYESDITSLKDNEIYMDIPYNIDSPYVDYDETKSINDIRKLICSNRIVPAYPLTIDDLKIFRTWLAKTMLMFDTYDYKTLHKYIAKLRTLNYVDRYMYLVEMEKNVSKKYTYKTDAINPGEGDPIYNIYTPEEIHMLQYYANGMYDDVVKYLSMYEATTVTPSSSKSCDCCINNISLIDGLFSGVNICDSVKIYRKNIYNTMVNMFSKTEIWVIQDKKFLINFKLYVDEIIKAQLPLKPTIYDSPFSISKQSILDCGCNINDGEQKYINILKNLSTSLGYIINDEITTHKNFINQSLYEWSSILYEQMYWA